jgi:hypothetical protein
VRPLKKRCRILPARGLGVYTVIIPLRDHHPSKRVIIRQLFEVIIRLDRMIQMGCPPALKKVPKVVVARVD